jgi:tRNA threonylcarbamoyl adenosine modification protein (Sua5/YciO/YrdC/YwlC family)
MCRDLSEMSRYAQVDNSKFRLLKNNTPGSYTFILKATKEVPKRLQHPKRSTIGIRVPDHRVALALLEELGEPMCSSTLILADEGEPLNDAEQIRDLLEKRVELVIDGGAVGIDFTTVIDLTGEVPVLLRRGKGEVAPFGIED